MRDQVIGGESMRGHTIGPSPASELADRTIAALARRGLRGPLLVQLFDGTQPTLVEVNPRIGSGTVLGNTATGGRLFAMVLEEACGGSASGDPDDYRADLRLYRYYGDVYSVDNRLLQITPGRE